MLKSNYNFLYVLMSLYSYVILGDVQVKHLNINKMLAVILSFVVVFTAVNFSYAQDESTTDPTAESTTEVEVAPDDLVITKEEAQKTLEEQRKELETKLKENEEKLKKFDKEAKTTEEYIDALDEKIGYLNEELTLLDSEISDAQKKVDTLEKQIKPLKEEIKEIQKLYDEAKNDFDRLNNEFKDTYDAYCLRLRAMYISGSDSILAALLTSSDISQFFSRYEMVKAVSKSDSELLQEVKSQMDKILTQQDGMNARRVELFKSKKTLDDKQNQYQSQKKSIESKQREAANKKVILAQDRAESDRLLAEYTAKTQMYTEYSNEDQELVESLDKEIDDLLKGLKDPAEVTTATAKEHNDKGTTKTDDKNALYSRSNAVLNLTYPAPGHYAVSSPFGKKRGNRYHKGIDFPYPMGTKVVASQKGIVITAKRLNYGYGYYVMIYHGTDAKGRKIVTLYGHNSSILVSVGQTVKKGQQIAKGGSTGNSTGPHCHFELIIDGTKVNAKNYLSK